MLTVMICDDEINICRLIIRLVQWEALDLSLVGTAHNGNDALAMMIEKKPDIVLTDIRMPVYNGIELASKAQQFGLESRFIVISGYDNFGYAQGAVKASVADYLLKPINAQELNMTLSRVCAQIRENRKEKARQQDIEKQLQDVNLTERNIYIRNVLLGNSAVYTTDMFSACGLHFTESSFGSFAVAFDGDLSASEKDMLAFQLKKLPDNISSDEYTCMKELLTCVDGNFFYGIFNYSNRHEGVIRSYMSDIYYICRKLCAVLPELQVTLAVGATVTEASQLSFSISCALDALHCRANIGSNRVLFFEDIPRELSFRPQLNPSLLSQLSTALDLCDGEAIEQALSPLFKDKGSSHVSYYKLAQELLNYFRQELSASHQSSGYPIENTHSYDQAVQELENAYTAQQMYNIVINYCSGFLSSSKRHGAIQSDIAVEQAKKYISENFAGECSLQAVANYAHLSPNYLSSIFKKKLGISMNAYLTVVRINEAKNLLKNSDISIYEIGERVGYNDPKHFRKVFKDNVGVTPAKYRTLYR